jgi:hypothetical protein
VASTYGWVTILLYCLWLNEHIHYILTKGTLDYGLCYTGDHDSTLYGYTDSNWAGSASDKKEHFRMLFQFGVSHDFMAKQEAI